MVHHENFPCEKVGSDTLERIFLTYNHLFEKWTVAWLAGWQDGLFLTARNVVSVCMERSLLATRLVNEPVPIRLTTPNVMEMSPRFHVKPMCSLFNEISNHKLLLVAANPPSTIKPYFYALAMEKISLGFGCISNFGDLISSTLQLIEVELVLWETAKIGNVLKYSDIHVKFGTASLWNQSYFMVLYTRIGNFV